MSWHSLSSEAKAPCAREGAKSQFSLLVVVVLVVVVVKRERRVTHLLREHVLRVDELEEAAQGLDVVLGLQLDDELVDDGRHRVADHARRVGDGAKDVGLDVLDDVGLDRVEVQADVVLEQEAGHGPHRHLSLIHI